MKMYKMEDHLEISEMCKGRNGGSIFLGNYEDSQNEKLLRKLNIKYVLNCTDDLEPPHFVSSGLKAFLRLPLRDTFEQDLFQHLQSAAEFIDKAARDEDNAGILIHCKVGISRSSAVLLGYLMRERKYTLNEALELLREKRPGACPNFHFLGQLLKLEKEELLLQQQQQQQQQ